MIKEFKSLRKEGSQAARANSNRLLDKGSHDRKEGATREENMR